MKIIKDFPTHAKIARGDWLDKDTKGKWWIIDEVNEFSELSLCDEEYIKNRSEGEEGEGMAFAWVDKEDCTFGIKG